MTLRHLLIGAGIVVAIKLVKSSTESVKAIIYSRRKKRETLTDICRDPKSRAIMQGIISRKFKGNNMFTHEVVAFTGKFDLPAAFQAVKDNGGEVSEEVNRNVTLLVLGENPAAEDIDTASALSIRIIKAAEFDEMKKAPVTMTPDEFDSVIKELKSRL